MKACDCDIVAAEQRKQVAAIDHDSSRAVPTREIEDRTLAEAVVEAVVGRTRVVVLVEAVSMANGDCKVKHFDALTNDQLCDVQLLVSGCASFFHVAVRCVSCCATCSFDVPLQPLQLLEDSTSSQTLP